MVNEKLEYAALRPMMALPAAAEGQPGWRHRLARAFAPMGSMRPAAVAALAALAFFLILALWLFLTMSGRIDAFFLPSPAATLDAAQTLLDLIAALDDNDDVQNVYANFELSDDALARFAA